MVIHKSKAGEGKYVLTAENLMGEILMRNRFKRLYLIECLMNYGWNFVTLYRRQGATHPPKKEIQKSKIVV